MSGAVVLLLLSRIAAPPAGSDAGSEKDARADHAAVIEEGRTTTLQLTPLLGKPIEVVAGSGSAYVRAVAKDRDERWAEAANLYREAHAEWTHRLYQKRSPDIENVAQKAIWERAQSERLGSQVQSRTIPASHAARFAFDRASLYRSKMMTVRATTGAVSPHLLRRARDGFIEALRLTTSRPDSTKQPAQRASEIRILLAATLASGSDREAARLELAHVRNADRDSPANAHAMAVWHAALGDLDSALDFLDTAVSRQSPDAARHIYFQNDWDRLRGNPRFERLFGR